MALVYHYSPLPAKERNLTGFTGWRCVGGSNSSIGSPVALAISCNVKGRQVFPWQGPMVSRAWCFSSVAVVKPAANSSCTFSWLISSQRQIMLSPFSSPSGSQWSSAFFNKIYYVYLKLKHNITLGEFCFLA